MTTQQATPATSNKRQEIADALATRAIPEDMTEAEAVLLLENIEEIAAAVRPLIAKVIRPESEPTVTKTATYPADGEVFELTLDGSAAENQPMAMVRADGYDPRNWKHDGPVVEGTQTRRFKLVSVGYCRTFDEVLKKLEPHGEVPQGQWREAFKVAYPKPNDNGPIGVADASWVDPDGALLFPCVFTSGYSNFYYVHDLFFFGSWRWLVAVK